ncbi:MAG: C_GCAxxG_C_C family protein [Promethearchaeota archaeon]|nr:MAG: C_GCAxxG_C_C family protein [Candidatus Lokiarchaeota archaeon]
MNNVTKAVTIFMKGFRCSQAILSTYGAQFGLQPELALKLASPFGSGMGSLGNTCGAVTGAIMVLGLKYGNTKLNEIKKKEKAYEVVREFVKRFTSRNGTILCRELLNCDLSTPEGRNMAIEKNFFIDLCPKFVQDSAEIHEEIL